MSQTTEPTSHFHPYGKSLLVNQIEGAWWAEAKEDGVLCGPCSTEIEAVLDAQCHLHEARIAALEAQLAAAESKGVKLP